MSNLNPQQFRMYHGSPSLLHPGEALRPGTSDTSPYGRDEKSVYLTTSPTSAAQWASDALEMRGESGSGYVYEVDAPDAKHHPHEDDPYQHIAPTAIVQRMIR